MHTYYCFWMTIAWREEEEEEEEEKEEEVENEV